MNNEQNKKTGYLSIDKPWMKYYQDYQETSNPKVNLTEYLKEENHFNGHLYATDYYGNKRTYDEFFERIDNASRALASIGVKKGDIIMNLTPNIPEVGEIFLGATQLGAASDFIDPRPDGMGSIEETARKLLEKIKEEKANYIVAVDICYLFMLKPIEKELKEIGVDNIIILNSADSMNLSGKISYLKDVINYNSIANQKAVSSNERKLKWYEALSGKLKEMQRKDSDLQEAIKTSPLNIYSYNDLVDNSRYTRFEKEHDPNQIIYIGHTSGTTGNPKPIPSTNLNSISTLLQLKKANANFNRGDNALHSLPFFAPFGTFDNYLLNLSSGCCNIDVPEFVLSEYGYLVLKYKPNVIMSNPPLIYSICEAPYLQNTDLSCIHTVIYGGDTMTPKKEEQLNKFLQEHNSSAVVHKGHGMSEVMGCGSYAQNDYNNYGSIGIPLPDTIYTIINPEVEDRIVELKFDDKMSRLKGELAISSDAVTPGILNDKVIIPHYDYNGKSYIRSKDIVEMDKDGIFYHLGRKDRSFSRYEGCKINPGEIEEVIVKHKDVDEVCIVPYYDDRKGGLMPICHLALNKDVNDEEKLKIVKEIVYNYIMNNKYMSSRQIPSKFRFRDEMPLTKNGKLDFNYLEQEEITDEINVDVKETNLSMDKIDIYKNKHDVRVRK